MNLYRLHSFRKSCTQVRYTQSQWQNVFDWGFDVVYLYQNEECPEAKDEGSVEYLKDHVELPSENNVRVHQL